MDFDMDFHIYSQMDFNRTLEIHADSTLNLGKFHLEIHVEIHVKTHVDPSLVFGKIQLKIRV